MILKSKEVQVKMATTILAEGQWLELAPKLGQQLELAIT